MLSSKNVKDRERPWGFSSRDARKQALLDTAIGIGWDFIGGMAMGGIMGGSSAEIKKLTQKLEQKESGGQGFEKYIQALEKAGMLPNKAGSAAVGSAGEHTGDITQGPKFSDRNFSYQELVAKNAIKGSVIKANRTVKLTNDGSIDKAWIVSEVLKQCESIQTKAPIPTYFVNVPDIGKNVEITSKGISHGFIKFQKIGGKTVPPRSLINARAALDLPQILRNSIEVNRSDRGDNSEVDYSHVLIGVVAMEDSSGKAEYYAVRSVVEERKNQGAILTEANVIGKLHAMNAKK